MFVNYAKSNADQNTFDPKMDQTTFLQFHLPKIDHKFSSLHIFFMALNTMQQTFSKTIFSEIFSTVDIY